MIFIKNFKKLHRFASLLTSKLNIRAYSSDCDNSNKYTPAVVYSNADIQKIQIGQENKGRSGVYLWVNLLNGKSYVGSSVNLYKRFSCYYSLRKLEANISNSIIYKALAKYGYSNFRLEILEYCEPNDVINREQYYLDLLHPEYNVCKTAGSPLGKTHTEEARAKISAARLGKTHSLETLEKLSSVHKGEGNPMFGKNHSDEVRKKMSEARLGRARPEGSGTPCLKLEVFDIKNNQATPYDSILAASVALGIPKSVISKRLAREHRKPYKGRYTFKKSS